jgi:hypothetical protein
MNYYRYTLIGHSARVGNREFKKGYRSDEIAETNEALILMFKHSGAFIETVTQRTAISEAPYRQLNALPAPGVGIESEALIVLEVNESVSTEQGESTETKKTTGIRGRKRRLTNEPSEDNSNG